MSKVSICITTYNRAETLPATLDSILKQTYRDFELIISDDNSQDKTAEICEHYCRKDDRIRYFRNAKNLKMPGNLNNAISKAKFEYIANLHDGDIYRSDLIEKWYAALENNPEALFVFNNYNSVDANGKHLFIYDYNLEELNDGRALIEYFLKTLTSGPWGTVMTRKCAYERYGLFNPQYGFISDVEMWLRLGLNGKFCYIKEALIDLTPREKDHPYYLPHWKIFCLNIIILLKYYHLFSAKYPDLPAKYPETFIRKKIADKARNDMVILLKHFNFSRLKEGNTVLNQLPIKEIRNKIGVFSIFGNKQVPYQQEILQLIKLIQE